VIRAIFPRMGGKERPGIVLAVIESDGKTRAVVAAPATTRRTNQEGRLPLADAPGFKPTSQLLLPMAALLPVARVLDRQGRVSEALLGAMEAGLEHWFGPHWRRTQPPLNAALAKARVLHPLPRAARRKSAAKCG
jgi:mRNA-degrading endonuclease toxin of MazEF toxin-antitoxin module